MPKQPPPIHALRCGRVTQTAKRSASIGTKRGPDSNHRGVEGNNRNLRRMFAVQPPRRTACRSRRCWRP